MLKYLSISILTLGFFSTVQQLQAAEPPLRYNPNNSGPVNQYTPPSRPSTAPSYNAYANRPPVQNMPTMNTRTQAIQITDGFNVSVVPGSPRSSDNSNNSSSGRNFGVLIGR